jgi:putative phosphotransacetylase
MSENAQIVDPGRIEQLVRKVIYQRLNLSVPKPASGPSSRLVVNISARHCHLNQEAVEKLFGPGRQLEPEKQLYQPGHFAAKETVALIGPRSRVISNLRILGPCRPQSQVELAFSDAVALGFKIPLRTSGDLTGTPGCMLMGPAGFFEMPGGVIRAVRHVHMSPTDADFYGVKQKDSMSLLIKGECGLRLDNFVVRISDDAVLEAHIDTDEANAGAMTPETECELIKH